MLQGIRKPNDSTEAELKYVPPPFSAEAQQMAQPEEESEIIEAPAPSKPNVVHKGDQPVAKKAQQKDPWAGWGGQSQQEPDDGGWGDWSQQPQQTQQSRKSQQRVQQEDDPWAGWGSGNGDNSDVAWGDNEEEEEPRQGRRQGRQGRKGKKPRRNFSRAAAGALWARILAFAAALFIFVPIIWQIWLLGANLTINGLKSMRVRLDTLESKSLRLGWESLNLGTVSLAHVIPFGISGLEIIFFPYESVWDLAKPWKWRQCKEFLIDTEELQIEYKPWMAGVWWPTFIFDIGTSYAGVVYYIVGDAAMGVQPLILPLFGGIELPTSGPVLLIIGVVISAVFVFLPEGLGRRLAAFIGDLTGRW